MPKRLTEARLYNITLYYLQKFEASEMKVRAMLQKRVQKEALKEVEIPQETPQWIENIIKKVVALGYVDDERFAKNQVRNMAQAGKSRTFIINKLAQNGIDSESAKEYMADYDETEETNETERAKKWLKKHAKGAFRTKDAKLFYQKDLAALARAGFSYAVAKEALQDVDASDDTDFYE